MLKLPHTKSCFVCGLNNPLGLKLDLGDFAESTESLLG